MEPKVQLVVNGQEVSQSDFNLVANAAALADDRVLAELLRLHPFDGSVARCIIPAGVARHGATATLEHKPLITTTASADAKVRIRPFRAVIGARSDSGASLVGAELNKERWRDIRTALHVGAGSDSSTDLQLAAGDGVNPRWDLIYVRVDVDVADPNELRYVKTGAEAVAGVNISPRSKTTLTLGVVQGTPGAIPVRPARPLDGGGSYYISLAFVRLASGHTLTTQVPANAIHEVYEPAPIAPAFGMVSARPANGNYAQQGNTVTSQGWTGATGEQKPTTYMSPAMTGGDEIFVAINASDTSDPSVPAGGTVVLDNTRDWRKRLFLTAVKCRTLSNDGFPWGTTPPAIGAGAWGGGTPGVNAPVLVDGQSFYADPTGGTIVSLTAASTPALAAGALLEVFVDMATGDLKCTRNGTDAARVIFLLIRATAPFINCDVNGT